MKKENFEKLIRVMTGRPLEIKTQDVELQTETEYCVIRKIEGSDRDTRFYWKTPKKQDNLMRSFITCFTSKYTEPNPANYGPSTIYTDRKTWAEMSDKERAFAYCHHRNNMFSKQALLGQIEANFNTPEMGAAMIKYGFYLTDYGTGIYVLYGGKYVETAVVKMMDFLKAESIPYRNEFSDAKWVLRFVLNISRPIHDKILTKFSATVN
jgi:hypothetical protein